MLYQLSYSRSSRPEDQTDYAIADAPTIRHAVRIVKKALQASGSFRKIGPLEDKPLLSWGPPDVAVARSVHCAVSRSPLDRTSATMIASDLSGGLPCAVPCCYSLLSPSLPSRALAVTPLRPRQPRPRPHPQRHRRSPPRPQRQRRHCRLPQPYRHHHPHRPTRRRRDRSQPSHRSETAAPHIPTSASRRCPPTSTARTLAGAASLSYRPIHTASTRTMTASAASNVAHAEALADDLVEAHDDQQ